MTCFIRTFSLKLGLLYLISLTGLATINPAGHILTCTLLLTILTFIIEFISGILDDFVNDHTYLMTYDQKLEIEVLNIIICLIGMVIIPVVILCVTDDIHGSVWAKIFLSIVLWIIGYVPERNDK